MNMGKAQIGVLAEKYRDLAVIWGTELLMPVKVAIEFLKDMTEHGEIVVGCDGCADGHASGGATSYLIPPNEFSVYKKRNMLEACYVGSGRFLLNMFVTYFASLAANLNRPGLAVSRPVSSNTLLLTHSQS